MSLQILLILSLLGSLARSSFGRAAADGLSIPVQQCFSDRKPFDLSSTLVRFRPRRTRPCATAPLNSFPHPSSGRQIDIGGDDDSSQEVALKFGFPFFGNVYSSAYVGANGYLTFGGPDRESQGKKKRHNRATRVAALMKDLALDASSSISYVSRSRKFVVTYRDVHLEGEPSKRASFQIALFDSGTVEVAYLQVGIDGHICAGLSNGVLGDATVKNLNRKSCGGTTNPSECVSREQLIAINAESSFWPRCDPSQPDKGSATGYVFGFYCSQDWADALNEVLTDLGYCGNGLVTRKFLAQIAYETGYYSTLGQPLDSGSGLIHMIPQNFRANAEDMDVVFPGEGLLEAFDTATDQQNFFKQPQHGFKSAAAWFKRTNSVIPNCGMDMFPAAYEDQTRCILGRVVDRSESLALVSKHIPCSGDCDAGNDGPDAGDDTLRCGVDWDDASAGAALFALAAPMPSAPLARAALHLWIHAEDE
eukprot:CAMPEP_0117694660 /NCGR_PEP_ID=MMETSP0804-20121206/27620_1 /TAXON_ID=1074897 /ORGANISM="Tetraselmis astigmatica, Strain CCMP880" /LENGTH=477 /DNA_ID=CAMNT_0005508471 /DNA_START=58 /DNA_END=1492 /DNA_ORIENTATION=-